MYLKFNYFKASINEILWQLLPNLKQIILSNKLQKEQIILTLRRE